MNRIYFFLSFIILLLMVVPTNNLFAEKANDFSLENLHGQEVTLSELYNKNPVLLVFWTTWCPYCVQEIPDLVDLQKEHGKEISILGINIKESPEKIKNILEKYNVNYTILLDKTGKVARAYGVRGIPLNIVINMKGEIVYKGHSLDKAEEELLK